MVEESQSLETAYPFEWGAATHIGRVRRKNEDAFAVEPETRLLLVLDGLGGQRHCRAGPVDR